MRRQPIELPKGTIDERGHTYVYLKVREYVGVDSGGAAVWLCECSCGQPGCGLLIEARGTRLRSGRQVSCGKARANKDIRQVARLKTPAKRRLAIARMGTAARWK